MANVEESGIVPDRSFEYLLRGSLNSYGKLTDAGLTRSNNSGNAQIVANTRVGANTPTGILAGSVVAAGTVNGTIVAATKTNVPLGIAVNNAVGYPYESSSGVASGKCVYLHGASSFARVDLYETHNEAGAVALVYAPGDKLYASQNGFLTKEASTEATVIAIVTSAPTTTDPFMYIQMRI